MNLARSCSAIMMATAAFGFSAEPSPRWPLWESYAAHFLDPQGRVIDRDAGDRTTSEGQAYAMFFALVGNDRPRFDLLMKWTAENLASGDLGANLPAWLWGQKEKGDWGVKDSNSAADADLWIAYTLLQAGKQWGEPRYTDIGQRLATQIVSREVVESGLGPILLPGPHGFKTDDSFVLNPSYLPLQLLLAMSSDFPNGPWKQMAEQLPRVLKESSSKGFVLDWVTYKRGKFAPLGPDHKKSLASYDAIRVYLWAGMLDARTEGRDGIFKSIPGMADYLRKTPLPPAEITSDGKTRNRHGGVGFSAALVPYLSALGNKAGAAEQQTRVQSSRNAAGLYGDPPRYYDQCLALFSTGWTEGRYHFSPDGNLQLKWRSSL